MQSTSSLPFVLDEEHLSRRADTLAVDFATAEPFPHVVVDDFLPDAHARFLDEKFPDPNQPVWRDWRRRTRHQLGKQGLDPARHHLLDPLLRLALQEFNGASFLRFLEKVSGISGLLPDPYFKGGGLHQILPGGFLHVHTDFNDYRQLQIYRRVNVIIYLTKEWRPEFGGELELRDSDDASAEAAQSIAPLYNRAVIFKTNKESFHGHPQPWKGPAGLTRRSVSIFYYTAWQDPGDRYEASTDFVE